MEKRENSRWLLISLIISIVLVVGLVVWVALLIISNHNLSKKYRAAQAEINSMQTQSNQQPSCQYYLSFLHNNQPCPYDQGSNNSTIPVN